MTRRLIAVLLLALLVSTSAGAAPLCLARCDVAAAHPARAIAAMGHCHRSSAPAASIAAGGCVPADSPCLKAARPESTPLQVTQVLAAAVLPARGLRCAAAASRRAQSELSLRSAFRPPSTSILRV